ncbi:MAG: alpha-amylase family glycosyl hydrolase [Chloroflexota bacterium]
MQPDWAKEAIFYHIYPLGFCGAPQVNDHHAQPVPALEKISSWIPHLKKMGINAMYLGPVFESNTHGYDTADYYHIDRRLGTTETLTRVIRDLHQANIRVILDGVFNHVGRDFWAFRDVQQNGQASPYCDWFEGLQFGKTSPNNDPFIYETWLGHYELVKLNLHNPQVRQHLMQAVSYWIQEFEIDGLRLDTADCLDKNFQHELSVLARTQHPNFWLMGEVIHGDYRQWVNPDMLHSVTNYEAYKGLYSSLVEKNLFEIAYTLNREFGETGIYRDLTLYNFADNHDVARVASNLKNPALLYPLYCLLFSMPGNPSIYYGSEWGLEGELSKNSDWGLRPNLDLSTMENTSPQPDLPVLIQKLANIRQTCPPLFSGDYHQLLVNSEQLAFARQVNGMTVIVQINSSAETATFDLTSPFLTGKKLVDLLNHNEIFELKNGRLENSVPPYWARILCLENQSPQL